MSRKRPQRTTRRLLALTLVPLVALASVLGCAGSAPKPSTQAAPQESVSTQDSVGLQGFDFLGEAIVSTREVVGGAPVGGLSGLAYDAERGVYYAISDDPASKGPARFYTLEVDFNAGLLDSGKIAVVAVTRLLDRDGAPFAEMSLDLESIVLTSNRTLLISSEGQVERGVEPFLREYRLDGSYVRDVPIPNHYLSDPDGTRGIRHNQGFESLSVLTSRNEIYTATETALRQDGPETDVGVASPARILRLDGTTGRARAEYVYLVEPVSDVPVSPDDYRTRGLVELEVIDETHLLALERSYTQGVGNDVELFLISTEGATDVRDWETIQNQSYRPVAKTLLLPLSALGLELDNLEGLAFGPRLADGRRSLLLVSDNNFNPSQRTQVLAFAIEDDAVTPSRIQGAGHRSPLEGAWIRGVRGTVTAPAARGTGLWLQGARDGDEATSDAIFVDPSLEDSAAEPGDMVVVSGLVEEAGRPGELRITGLRQARLEILERGLPLPEAVEIGIDASRGERVPPTRIDDDGMTSYRPKEDALDFYESLEGMRVSISSSTVVGPTSRFGEIAVIDEALLGRDAIRTGAGGLIASQENARPPILLLAPRPGISAPEVGVGDRFEEEIEGVLDYAFGTFRIFSEPLPPAKRRAPGHLRRSSESFEDALVLASFNVENLSAQSEPEKFVRLGRTITEVLGSPDILALQEIQDDSGRLDDGTVSAEGTLNRLVLAITAAGGPAYRHLSVDPVDGADGGMPGANIRLAYLYRPDRVGFVARGLPGHSAPAEWLTDGRGPFLSPNPALVDPEHPAFSADPARDLSGSRKPLTAEFEFGGRRIFLVNVHLRSKRGDSPIFGSRQPPVRATEPLRLAESIVVRDFLDRLLDLDPSAAVVALGDFNEHPHRPPMRVFEESGLVNAVELVPEPERYTYIYRGISQVLDNVLLSPSLTQSSRLEVEIVHSNSLLPDSERASDHDPVLLRLEAFSERPPSAWNLLSQDQMFHSAR